MQFQRFLIVDQSNQKINTKILCNKWLKLFVGDGNPTNYELFSIIRHIGSSLDSGHYTAIVKTNRYEYHEFNDHSVSKAK